MFSDLVALLVRTIDAVRMFDLPRILTDGGSGKVDRNRGALACLPEGTDNDVRGPDSMFHGDLSSVLAEVPIRGDGHVTYGLHVATEDVIRVVAFHGFRMPRTGAAYA
jgi:hypothetical protein